MEKRIVMHRSPDYERVVALRDKVLRQPLGLVYSEEQLEAESGDTHLALFTDAVPVACLLLCRLSKSEMKMRQVAVATERQGEGLGRTLVAWSEAEAIRQGATRMVLHARVSALPFYERLSYVATGPTFEEVGITHRRMEKALA